MAGKFATIIRCDRQYSVSPRKEHAGSLFCRRLGLLSLRKTFHENKIRAALCQSEYRVLLRIHNQIHGEVKCQSRCFASQIAAATLCCLLYDILSVAKRFGDYETIGGLFREISRDAVQLSVLQQIWGILQDQVTAIAKVFDLLDDEIFDAIINHSEQMAHIAQFYNLKSAC